MTKFTFCFVFVPLVGYFSKGWPMSYGGEKKFHSLKKYKIIYNIKKMLALTLRLKTLCT